MIVLGTLSLLPATARPAAPRAPRRPRTLGGEI